MEQLSKLTTRPKRTLAKRLNRNSRIVKTIIQAVQEKKGEQLALLDLRKIPEAVSDYFLICEATSQTQVKAIADFVEWHVKQVLGEIPYRHEGLQHAHWVLIDYVSIVVHVMLPETRKFYKLEELWSDAVMDDL